MQLPTLSKSTTAIPLSQVFAPLKNIISLNKTKQLQIASRFNNLQKWSKLVNKQPQRKKLWNHFRTYPKYPSQLETIYENNTDRSAKNRITKLQDENDKEFDNVLSTFQWYINDFYNNHAELEQLIARHQPKLICFQETKLQP